MSGKVAGLAQHNGEMEGQLNNWASLGTILKREAKAGTLTAKRVEAALKGDALLASLWSRIDA